MASGTQELHRRALAEFGERVRAVADDQWHLPTPCSEWDVRALVNHMTSENLWTTPLFEGKTVAEVGDRYDGDVLGDDPKGGWEASARAAEAAVGDAGAMERTVHLSFGDFPGREYTMQLLADLVIHCWDLARAIGADERLDSELVEQVAAWFEPAEAGYRTAGAIGPRVEVPPDADPQTRLLAAFGRTA
jgi:uncharacterized protein (TIGR03086 family)